MLCYAITQLRPRYDALSFRVRYGPRLTQPECLLDKAEFSATPSSLVDASSDPKIMPN